jgi:MFS family permease
MYGGRDGRSGLRRDRADAARAPRPLRLLRLSVHPADLRRAVWLLGAAQCAAWGVLYYGYAVLVVPLGSELALSRPLLAGAYSSGLLVMALAAGAVGRRIDRDRGRATMRWGVVLAVVGLLALAGATSVWHVYAAWLVLGLAMACVLYEPAFGLVLRAIDEPERRLRALSAVTVLGGLASTLCLPLLGALVAACGWRAALVGAAGALLATGLVLELGVFPVLRPRGAVAPIAATHGALPRGLAAFALPFVLGTLSAMALTVLLVPMLVDRGTPPTQAAAILAALGVSQLPGRLWLLRATPPPRALTLAPPALEACGLLLVASAADAAVALGVVTFGVGAGLQTVARPLLVQQRYGLARAGAVNGGVARLQGFARAAGPVLAATGAAFVDARVVFAALAAALLLLLPLVALAERPAPAHDARA